MLKQPPNEPTKTRMHKAANPVKKTRICPALQIMHHQIHPLPPQPEQGQPQKIAPRYLIHHHRIVSPHTPKQSTQRRRLYAQSRSLVAMKKPRAVQINLRTLRNLPQEDLQKRGMSMNKKVYPDFHKLPTLTIHTSKLPKIKRVHHSLEKGTMGTCRPAPNPDTYRPPSQGHIYFLKNICPSTRRSSLFNTK